MVKQKLIDEFKSKLQEQVENYDVDDAHSQSDKILCELLIALGYGEVVEVWKKVDKWYA